MGLQPMQEQLPSENECEQLLPLLIALSEEDVGGQEREKITAHLAGCAACRAKFSLLSNLPDALDRVLPKPGEQLHARIMGAVRSTPRRRVLPFRYMSAIAAALCGVFVIIALVMGGFGNGLEAEDGMIGNSSMPDMVPDRVEDGTEAEDWETSYGKPDLNPSKTEPLEPTPDSPDASAEDVLHDPESADAPSSSQPPTLELPMGNMRFEAVGENEYLSMDGAYTLRVTHLGDIIVENKNGQFAICEQYTDGEVAQMKGSSVWLCQFYFYDRGVTMTLTLWKN